MRFKIILSLVKPELGTLELNILNPDQLINLEIKKDDIKH